MDYTDIKSLFNYLENNRKQLNPLQNDFIDSQKAQFKLTGILTYGQIESLRMMKEKVHSLENYIPEPDLVSGLYSQLIDITF